MAKVDYVVRDATPADYPAVRACLAQVFQETEGQKAAWFNDAIWEWQYLRTERPSLIVVAEIDGRIGGYYHVLSLPMRRAGRDIIGGLIQDVGTPADFRGRGVFREVGGYALRRAGELGMDFIYGFPNERSRPSFERNHHFAQFTQVPVYIAPLDPIGAAGARLGVPRLGTALGRLTSPLHHPWRRRHATLRPGETVARVNRIDDETAAVCRAFSASRSVHVVRSPHYLNWRFLEKPNNDYEAWVLRSGDSIIAFMVAREAMLFGARCLVFVELGAQPGHDDALRRLIATRLVTAQRDGVHLAVTMGLHPFFDSLGKIGFVHVPDRVNPKPFKMIVKNPDGAEAPDITDASQWMVTLADWDVL